MLQLYLQVTGTDVVVVCQLMQPLLSLLLLVQLQVSPGKHEPVFAGIPRLDYMYTNVGQHYSGSNYGSTSNTTSICERLTTLALELKH